jgi:hypothetical protein
MTHSDQIRDDLSFVRDVVARRDRQPFHFTAPYYIWAVYVLIGYSLLDINVGWANWSFFLGWFPAGMATGIARRMWVRKHGELDRVRSKRAKMHFMWGSLLAIAAVIGLACCVPVFRGPIIGQVMVILFGIIYFLAGVHFDRSFLWLGPVLVVGGIVVGFVPHYGWTVLGAVIAGGLCAAALINSHQQNSVETSGN